MSAGSGASNLGYSKIPPLNNINGAYVNVDNSNSPATFGSNEIPGLPGLAGAKNNVDAAAGIVPGICVYKGGSRKLKRKIKNITKHYKKMKSGSKRMKSLKHRIKHRFVSRTIARKLTGGRKSRRHRHRSQRGGYSQYQNNLPFTPVYKVAGVNLPASQLALANPPPITKLSNCVNCTDNYDHYTNKGFPSRGH
jgi:hypothetical protein